MKKNILLFIIMLGIILGRICIFFHNQTLTLEKPVKSYETISPKYQSRGYTNLYRTSLANLSRTKAFGAGSAMETTSTSWSRFASGGRTRLLLRGSSCTT